MKVTPRFIVRAALVVTAGGVIGAFGACKDATKPVTPPPTSPPPPPPVLTAPAAPTAAVVDATTLKVSWTYNDNTVTGFRLDRCQGANCTNFAQVGSNLAGTARDYTDAGLTASTQYSYRVRALRGSDTSAWSPTANATTGGPKATGFTMVAAGEISTGNSSAGPSATAKLVSDILTADPNAFAVTIGNNFTDPNAATFAGTQFDGTWGLASTAVGGTFGDRARYALGNNDFGVNRGPAAVYGYFGTHTGEANKGWFSFDKGSWHIVVLNTSDWQYGSGPTFGITPQLVEVPSDQVTWLADDLSKTTQKCIAVISWERRFFTTGDGKLGFNSNMKPIGRIMYDNGVDLLISAKDKLYSRFTPLNSETHAPDPKGFRQFIVGTGGRTNDGKPAGTPAEREAYIGRDATTPDQWGVLKLTLGDGNYSWEFVNTVSGGPTDKSDAPVACHQ